MARKPRIAHLAGPIATIQNTPPLVTSNKARAKYGLPLNEAMPVDTVRAQRLAAPAKVYVEQFSAHPLEADAAELCAPPDGYVGEDGRFLKERRHATDKPVYEVELRPEDGLYGLPYMGRQADGSAWEDECTAPLAPEAKSRQPFLPDGSRAFEEIDRFGYNGTGRSGLISARAEVDFYRVLPPSGYTKGLPASKRTDEGEGDIAPEVRGRDFFCYRPYHINAWPTRHSLARLTNAVQKVMSSGRYDGAVWTEGSPSIEETSYWLNLLIDTTLPLCGNAAQRAHGMISSDGAKNIVDSVEYLTSRIWADGEGRNKCGVVVIQEQQIFAAREVQKADARPGGYVATGGHGGILGGVGFDGPPVVLYTPTTKHTYASEVNLSRLPGEVEGLNGRVAVKDASGALEAAAIPKVGIVKDGSYMAEEPDADTNHHADLIALIDGAKKGKLAGFVVEALTPYGSMTSNARNALMRRAIYSGMPVARVGRGNTQGFVPLRPPFIAGSNLTATKARLLLMASLLRFGALPKAQDPERPTPSEQKATADAAAKYQAVFDTH